MTYLEGNQIIDVQAVEHIPEPRKPVLMMALSDYPEGQNVLGLEGSKDPMADMSGRLFDALSYIAQAALRASPETRKQLLAGDEEIELPEVRNEDGTRYVIRRLNTYYDELNAKVVSYLLSRTDRGNPGAGFMIRQVGDHNPIVSLSHDTDEAPEESVLRDATKAVWNYAKGLKIGPDTLARQSETPHLAPKDIETLTERAVYETTKRYKALSASQKLGRQVLKVLRKAVTKEDPNGLGRVISPARIALIALTLPVPGYGGFLPASTELAFDGISAASSVIGGWNSPSPEELYEQKNLDIAGLDPLEQGSKQPIAYISPKSIPSEAAEFGLMASDLQGKSPRRIEGMNALLPVDCSVLDISPDVDTSRVAIFTTNKKISKWLTIEPIGQSVYVCNRGDEFVSPTEAALVFDTVPKK